MWYREYFPPSRPRQARGGIKAQSRRGSFGQTWWAKRWLAVLESFDIGARLGRGRSYARRGQVLSIEIAVARVQAQVQGSRPQPYTVTIGVKRLSAADWKKLARTLAREARFAAKLLAGDMPQDIEKAFTAAGLSLFPEKLGDLTTECSCPDWSNPCKHVAAVYYLLGEEFDRDPFLIFKLRGLGREELVEMLSRSPKPTADKKTKGTAAPPESPPTEPLPADPGAFWAAGSLPDDFFGVVQVPPVFAGLPKRLGNFPFWRGEERLLDALEPIYRQAGQAGLDAYLGETRGQVPGDKG
jgi:uncharacterized Zn finger protein